MYQIARKPLLALSYDHCAPRAFSVENDVGHRELADHLVHYRDQGKTRLLASMAAEIQLSFGALWSRPVRCSYVPVRINKYVFGGLDVKIFSSMTVGQ